MSSKDILKLALNLRPEDKLTVVEGLLKSLDEPDKKLDEIWAEEAEKKLKAYREDRLEGVPIDQVFDQEKSKLFFQDIRF